MYHQYEQSDAGPLPEHIIPDSEVITYQFSGDSAPTETRVEHVFCILSLVYIYISFSIFCVSVLKQVWVRLWMLLQRRENENGPEAVEASYCQSSLLDGH